MQNPTPQALLFDLGGVVLDIDFDRAFKVWSVNSQLTYDEIKNVFAFDEPYQRHERGEIGASEYYDHLVRTLRIDTGHAKLAQGWNSIYVGEIAETVEIVQAIRKQIPCFAFTNTNAAHMAAWTSMFPSLASSFDKIFASHLMGLRKPELRAFEHVAQTVGVAPGSILFFDDLLENVEGAIAAGLPSIHVRTPTDVRNALIAFGFAL
ncbi:MAG: HAD-IA family hydrolase [Pseudomonadota bacterium]